MLAQPKRCGTVGDSHIYGGKELEQSGLEEEIGRKISWR